MYHGKIPDLHLKLIEEEGWESRPYKCTSGKTTIGAGHNLDVEGLCDAAILAQLEYDVAKATEAAKRVCASFWEKLNPVRQDVMVLWAFQLGEKGMSDFVTTLALIEQGKFAHAADRLMATKWARQTPARVRRLAKMLERGTYG